MNPGYVYMLCNDRKNVLYTGSARDLENRVRLHRSGLLPGFTKKYNVKRLVYFEVHPTVYIAAARESQIKGYTRAKKEALIAKENPEWRDLYDEAFGARRITRDPSAVPQEAVETVPQEAVEAMPQEAVEAKPQLSVRINY